MKEQQNQNHLGEQEPEQYITPSLVGTVDKIRKKWYVSTPIPSIEYARIITSKLQPNLQLRSGMEVSYDLITQPGDEKNVYLASNLRRYEGRKGPKPGKSRFLPRP